MISPRSRLTGWTGLLVVPFATLATAMPSARELSLLLIGLFFLLVVFDAWKGMTDARAGRGLYNLSVELPEVVRLTQYREGELDLVIRNPGAVLRQVRVGVPFPPEVVSEVEDQLVRLSEQAPDSKLAWTCQPKIRGKYELKTVYLEAPTPLGFWGLKRAVPVRSELRVYPNLMDERRHLAALFLNRGGLGVHVQRQVGKGREFEKLRDYIPGDSFEDVHWKATAKRGHPVTKLFQLERTQEVYVLVDASRLSAQEVERPSLDPNTGAHEAPLVTVLERFMTSALIMALASQRQGDLFGLVTFSNTTHTFVRAKNGKEHFNTCRDALYTLKPRRVTPDYEELCTLIRQRIRKRALLVFLTSLNDPRLAESFVRNMDLIGRQHLVLANMITPPEVRPLFSGPEAEHTEHLYRALGGHLQWNDLRETGNKLKRKGVQFHQVPNESFSLELVSQYMNVKNRQIL
jgi:uncharacterized protein (DUF58 family)